mmetsp:Transcript_19367/g.36102  ORF Transcript_19367/g.36102 Transcript_19367/m.36102 type:complete len:748 (+) Transcript_19367:108-2351(+)
MLWRGLGRGARCQRLASLLSQSPPSQTVFRRALSSTPTASASPLGARDILRGRLNVALEQLFRKHYPLEDVDVSHYDGIVFPTPKPEKFGDYQCNVCMPLAKRLKVKPRDVATQLVSLLQVEDIVASTTIAGPGFLNFRVSEGFVKSKLGALLGDSSERLGVAKTLSPLRTVLDYSSPNIAKEMHVGHLRSTIIGHSLSRVLEFLGHEVVGVNHVGDWGTQFGMLIEYISVEHPHLYMNSNAEFSGEYEYTIGDLVTFYKKARVKFDSDASFREAARSRVVQLQQGQRRTLSQTTSGSECGAGQAQYISCSGLTSSPPEDTFKVWKQICEVSRKEFGKVYDLLGVDGLEERGESFYNFMLQDVVQLCLDMKVATVSDGAVCIFPPGTSQNNDVVNPSPPLMIQKSDGGHLYATTDLAALIYRVWVEGADRVLYVTDLSQQEHFKKVFEAARRTGLICGDDVSGEYDDEGYCTEDVVRRIICRSGESSISSSGSSLTGSQRPRAELCHVGFGLVLGDDGKKLKSREGEALRLMDLLDAAVLRSRRELEKRRDQHAAGGEYSQERLLSDDEVAAAARIIGLGAVKYADLSMNREGNYKFSYDKMLSMNGNTAPYLLYAYARIRGIQRQGAVGVAQSAGVVSVSSRTAPPSAAEFATLLDFETPAELQLAKHLIRLHEVLLEVERTLLPNKLCEYLYDLSIRFNSFYETCSVLHAETPSLKLSRLHLCNATADTLKLGLRLLGLETVDRL